MGEILEGDCLEVMAGMEENSVDSIVCDPPYALGFMGKAWDRFPTDKGPKKPFANQSKESKLGGMPYQEWCRGWAVECLRVAKPGAYLLAFGGTRTFHRLACAIEDAGWTLRDTLSWNYGSGFPKSHDISKALDSKAGAEREVLETETRYNEPSGIVNAGRGPEARTLVDRKITAPATPEAKQWDGFGTALKPAWEPVLLFQKPLEGACSEELHAITGWRRWHTKAPKESWGGKPEDEKSWHASKCYKLCQTHRLDYWERPADEGNIERWIFERRWDALEPKARGRHVIIGKNKRVVLSREQYKNKHYICVAANVLKWGCGALNIDGCRISGNKPKREDRGKESQSIFGIHSRHPAGYSNEGRWPANFLLSHTIFCEKVGEKRVKPGGGVGEASQKPISNSLIGLEHGGVKMFSYADADGLETVEDWRCAETCPVRMLDEQSGQTKTRPHDGDGKPLDTQGTGWGFRRMPSTISDEGSASRFFYCAKASREERNAGLEAVHTLFEKREGFREKQKQGNRPNSADATGKFPDHDHRPSGGNNHPTVKPIALMRYLCRLVTPPGGMVLDCFAGSGSTGCAAVLERLQFIGIEKEKGYAEIARARIAHFSGRKP